MIMNEARATQMRQEDLNYQHGVCDAYYPQFEHLRPLQRIIGVEVLETDEDVQLFDPYPLNATSMKEAARRCASRHGITVQELIGPKKDKRFSPARSDFVKACLSVPLCKSKSEIAVFMSRRDPTTILHYARMSA